MLAQWWGDFADGEPILTLSPLITTRFYLFYELINP